MSVIYTIEDVFHTKKHGVVLVVSVLDITKISIGDLFRQKSNIWKIISMEKFSTCFGQESNRWGFQVELELLDNDLLRCPIPGTVEHVKHLALP